MPGRSYQTKPGLPLGCQVNIKCFYAKSTCGRFQHILLRLNLFNSSSCSRSNANCWASSVKPDVGWSGKSLRKFWREGVPEIKMCVNTRKHTMINKVYTVNHNTLTTKVVLPLGIFRRAFCPRGCPYVLLPPWGRVPLKFYWSYMIPAVFSTGPFDGVVHPARKIMSFC
jgi:hypothetical protein